MDWVLQLLGTTPNHVGLKCFNVTVIVITCTTIIMFNAFKGRPHGRLTMTPNIHPLKNV